MSDESETGISSYCHVAWEIATKCSTLEHHLIISTNLDFNLTSRCREEYLLCICQTIFFLILSSDQNATCFHYVEKCEFSL